MEYEKGKWYQFDGQNLVVAEPSGEAKIPVSSEALEAVKAARKEAQKLIGMRPELSLVASAMILEAAKSEHLAESIKQYGQRIYSS